MKEKFSINPGDSFHYLVVLRLSPIRLNHQKVWECRCRCGKLTAVRSQQLRTGGTKSCGCYNMEARSIRFKGSNNPAYKHGKSKTYSYEQEHWRRKQLKKYNMVLQDYTRLYSQQGGKCAICGNINQKQRALYVDHNHLTNQVRGLLCNRCNLVLGHVKDNPELLTKAVQYLQKYNLDKRSKICYT